LNVVVPTSWPDFDSFVPDFEFASLVHDMP
jgi:hypothetical protein